MARIVITPFQIPGSSNLLDKIGSEPIIEDLSGLSTYAFRGKIISDRYTRGFDKIPIKGPTDAYETSGPSIMAKENDERDKAIKDNRAKGKLGLIRSQEEYLFENVAKDFVSNPTYIKNVISIVDIDFKPEQRATRRYESLTLPFIPRELNYNPTSKFIGIATMARNNPHYNFTGSEDTLTFEIDWYSNREDRTDVITCCRWVEALSKGNGYDDIPHRIKLVWGNDNKLYNNDIWLVTDAPYVLSDFVDSFKKDGNIINVGLLPQQAIQTVTLKRVTINNRLSSEIIGDL